MAWVRVQTVGANVTSATTVPVTIASTAAGNVLVAFGAGHTSLAIADSASQAWTTLTEESNVPSSTKHYSWFYFLNTASGITTVTLTTGGAANTGYLQVMEYSFTGDTLTFVPSSETNFTETSGSTVGGSLTAGAAGDLTLIGSVGNTTNGTTFSVGSGITSIVGTCNQSNVGGATVGVGENLSCAASPAVNLGISPANSEGATGVAFHATAAAAAGTVLIAQESAINRSYSW